MEKQKKERVSCQRCGQDLTDPESVKNGMGPECAMTAGSQFAAISSLVTAMATGWVDPIANKFLAERRVLEAVHNRARQRADIDSIRRTQKRLNQINGILVRRELLRLKRTSKIQEVA